MDHLSNLITQLNTSQALGKPFIIIKQSKFSMKQLQVLQNEGFISHYTVDKTKQGFKSSGSKETGRSSKIAVYFKRRYPKGSLHTAVQVKDFSLRRISKRSRRVQVDLASLWKLHNGLGVQILSTNHGLITDRQARQFQVGGELICQIILYCEL